MLEAFKDIAPDISVIGTRSLRSGGRRGGGKAAAANAGMSDRLFKRHGRWSSDSAQDGYVKDSLFLRLSISQVLGL